MSWMFVAVRVSCGEVSGPLVHASSPSYINNNRQISLRIQITVNLMEHLIKSFGFILHIFLVESP